jgi:ribosome-associated toxin RatA of RatAB toxin-antitoxin module
MAEHHASVMVNAPVHEVYSLFTHFNDFPKFMSFVKEVTYYDNQRSHWVADIIGRHEWDAVNEHWVEDQQIGWRSTSGIENTGKVTFQPAGLDKTRVDVYISYNPPAGILGDIGENLGAGKRFEKALQHDLDNFARMVDQAPRGALDPHSSNYLFNPGSAAAKGTTTERQDQTMGEDYRATGTPPERPILDRDIIEENPDTGVPPPPSTAGNTIPPLPSER